MGMGDEGKWLLRLLPKGWDLRDGAIAFGVGSGGAGAGTRPPRSPGSAPPGACGLLPPSAGVGTRSSGWFFLIYLHLSRLPWCLFT